MYVVEDEQKNKYGITTGLCPGEGFTFIVCGYDYLCILNSCRQGGRRRLSDLALLTCYIYFGIDDLVVSGFFLGFLEFLCGFWQLFPCSVPRSLWLAIIQGTTSTYSILFEPFLKETFTWFHCSVLFGLKANVSSFPLIFSRTMPAETSMFW